MRSSSPNCQHRFSHRLLKFNFLQWNNNGILGNSLFKNRDCIWGIRNPNKRSEPFFGRGQKLGSWVWPALRSETSATNVTFPHFTQVKPLSPALFFRAFFFSILQKQKKTKSCYCSSWHLLSLNKAQTPFHWLNLNCIPKTLLSFFFFGLGSNFH